MEKYREFKTDYSNIKPSIEEKLNKGLHNQPNHPIEIVKRRIYGYSAFEKFIKFDNMNPVVDTTNNFDLLRIPPEHVARSKSDTYYVSKEYVLRTHTSAHQNELLAQGYQNFLVTGDVYRKDEIDSSHYPVFHQMEGVGKVQLGHDPKEDLLDILVGLVNYLFPDYEYRVNPDYFPFTEPSYEIEVKYNPELPDEDENAWLEVLGCGVVHNEILNRHGSEPSTYWAFGLGLERLAMVMFGIPDIRCFWSDHPKFLDQFKSGEIVKFQPYSVLDSISNDISFWIDKDQVRDIIDEKIGEEDKWKLANDFYDYIRDMGGDWIEKVTLKDEFYHPKKKMLSRTYRITYSPKDPSLNSPGEFKEIVLEIQNRIRGEITNQIPNIELR